ncbi:MAG: hypothetical protein NZ484_00200 [Patescibacteria group bacterium]|nr:hypothetical protein [Patescibacteria group bacterium]MDW8279600.1 hypothetical protein [bacterium]
MSQILIIGAGEIGKALGKILSKENKINYWDKYGIFKNQDLKDLVLKSETILICTPAGAVFEVWKKIKKFNLENKFLICVSKGIDLKTNQRIDEILADFKNFGLLYGPMIAEELNQNQFGFGILASKNKKVLKLKNIFLNTKIKIKTSNDVVGVALSGVLKNIYALGLGLLDGLNLGLNFKGYYVTQAINEMFKIVKVLGGRSKTVFEICGLGDFVATGFSKNSANYKVGFLKGKNQQINQTSEGLKSIRGIKKILKSKHIKTPILDKLYNIFYLNQEVSKILEI